MTEPVFEAWPKTPRYFRDVTITEKIDGTNACVVIDIDGTVYAQSRTRIITPRSDNYGFAAWVEANRLGLAETLGPGRHFGEWWGQGIQRKYNIGEKRFSLFNTHLWHADALTAVDGLSVVPVLYAGRLMEGVVSDQLDNLRFGGSVAAPGFEKPEGICIYHHAAQQVFKALLENDEIPKGIAA